MAYIREDQYIQNFFALRNSNIDSAYQELINNIITSFRAPAPGNTMDIDYILQNIQQRISPVYFNPTSAQNPMTQLPIAIINQNPEPSLKKQSFELFYPKLKASVGVILSLPIELNLPDVNIPELTNILMDLNSKKEIPKRLETSHCFLIGKVLLNLKNKLDNPVAFAILLKDINISRSYALFLVKFASLCMDFPRLKTICRPVHELSKYFKYIKIAVQADAAFWR